MRMVFSKNVGRFAPDTFRVLSQIVHKCPKMFKNHKKMFESIPNPEYLICFIYFMLYPIYPIYYISADPFRGQQACEIHLWLCVPSCCPPHGCSKPAVTLPPPPRGWRHSKVATAFLGLLVPSTCFVISSYRHIIMSSCHVVMSSCRHVVISSYSI